MDSTVVNVFEATTNKVCFTSTRRSTSSEVMTIDIGDEMEAQARMGVGVQRCNHHLRAQIGSANANVDHVMNVAQSGTTRCGANAIGVKRAYDPAHRESDR